MLFLTSPFPAVTTRRHTILLVLLASMATISDNLSYTNKYREISSVLNTVGQIPCSISSFDDVSMILWFKDSSGSPIYSYDARNEKEPRHMTLKNDWGLRLYFRVWPSSRRSPALMIRDLQPSDAGLYRCRVDYRNSPTANSIIRLKIIEPPTHLEIRDTSRFRPISDQQMVSAGQHSNPNLEDITYLGPYVEGQNVTVVCTAYGGKPLPEVIWFENGLMVDGSYELTEGNYVTNELTIVNLGKHHSHDLYTCQASNNNETKAISHRVNLDVYLTAKQIELEVPDQMTAGVQYNFVCKTAGAYPSVRMEFWRAQKRIGPKYQIKSDADNTTLYTISFKPEIQDDESTVYCRAENPWITGNQIESRKKLRVYYAPVVVLRFGSSKISNFSEGESVFFECHIKSNPPLKEIHWFFQDQNLVEDKAAGIFISGFTLQLRHLTHLSGGSYRCEAINEAGKGFSNSLSLLINIAPRCVSSGGGLEERIPLALGESYQLKCNILAWPPDLNFYWTLNQSKVVLPIPNSGNRDIVRKNNTTSFPTTTTTATTTTAPATTTPTLTSTSTSSTTSETPVNINSNDTFEFDQLLTSEGFFANNSSFFGTGSGDTSEENFITRLEASHVWEENFMENSLNDTSNEDTNPHFNDSSTQNTNDISYANETFDTENTLSNSNVISFKTSKEYLEAGETGTARRRRRRVDARKSEVLQHQSTLPYTILSADDYGTVACWARNSYGKQLRPCLFHIISPEEADPNPTEGEARKDVRREEMKERTKATDGHSRPEANSRKLMVPVGNGANRRMEEEEEQPKQEEVMRKDSEEMEVKEGEEELRPLWYKLRGTLGITIISMGVLIFIGSLAGCSWLYWNWKRKNYAPSAQVAVALQRTAAPPSPSIHNDGKTLGAANIQEPTLGLSQASPVLRPESVGSYPTLEQSQPILETAKYFQKADNDKNIVAIQGETFTVTFICEQI